ncbi:hypothetical protein [Candidatus Pantoea persica]|uniref:hypothetical protein n=1 Tax=Candidatus Pantoea persica TaxID=2518128 RepID=UPI0035A90150|nr:DNA endonuclease SmrA [Candidatus Pantoea persica]
MNLDDEDLFRDAMGDVTPLKDSASTLWLKSPSGKAPRRTEELAAEENLLNNRERHAKRSR